MAYDIVWEEKGTIVTFHGIITYEEINEANGKLHGDSKIDDHRYSIWNFLDADLSPITKLQITTTAATDKAASSYIRRMKLALVSRGDYNIEISKCYIEWVIENIPSWEFALFESKDEAVDWSKS